MINTILGGSKPGQIHSDSVANQHFKDLNDNMSGIKDAFSQFKRAGQALETLSEKGPAKDEAQQTAELIMTRAEKSIQTSLEGALKGMGLEQFEARGVSQRETQRILKTADTYDELDKGIKKVIGSFSEMDQAVDKSQRGGLLNALVGGMGIGTMWGGAMQGNILQMGAGMAAVGRYLQPAGQAYRQSREKGEGVAASLKILLGEVARRSGVLAGAAWLYGTQQTMDRAEEYVPQALGFGYSMSRAGLRSGGTGFDYLTRAAQLQTPGPFGVGGNRVNILSPEQLKGFTEMFAQTGGGTNAEFSATVKDFAKYTVLYGQSANTMMQASRSLQMWIPGGDVGGEFKKAIDTMRQQGVAPALQAEQLQTMSAMGTQLAIMSLRPSQALGETTRAFRGPSQVGISGKAAGQAIQGLQQTIGASLNDPAMFGMYIAAGIDPERIALFQMGAATPTAEEAKLISNYVGGFMGRAGAPPVMNQYAQWLAGGKGVSGAYVAKMGLMPDEEKELLMKNARGTVDADVNKTLKDLKHPIEGQSAIFRHEFHKIRNAFSQASSDALKGKKFIQDSAEVSLEALRQINSAGFGTVSRMIQALGIKMGFKMPGMEQPPSPTVDKSLTIGNESKVEGGKGAGVGVTRGLSGWF